MSLDRKPRSLHVHRSRDKIERLRSRVRQALEANREDPVPGILGAIIDMLEEMTS